MNRKHKPSRKEPTHPTAATTSGAGGAVTLGSVQALSPRPPQGVDRSHHLLSGLLQPSLAALPLLPLSLVPNTQPGWPLKPTCHPSAQNSPFLLSQTDIPAGLMQSVPFPPHPVISQRLNCNQIVGQLLPLPNLAFLTSTQVCLLRSFPSDLLHATLRLRVYFQEFYLS